MKLLYSLLGVSSVSAASLCGDWMALKAVRCEAAVQCCNNQDNSGSIPACPTNLQPIATSVISQESFRFAGDNKYAVSFMVATGQSCPLSYTDGGVLFVVDTEGTYANVGDNTDLGNGWQKITYTPTKFYATVAKNNQESFFTAGTLTGGELIGPCMKMSEYLAHEQIGCPCNGTWNVGAISAGNTTAPNTRLIEPSKCPNVNLTNGTMGTSCPEQFFFNTATRYGNARITNRSSTERLLEITQPMFNQTLGYNNSVVYANFTANFTCPSSLTGNAPTESSAVRLGLLIPYVFAVWVIGGLAFVVH